MLRVGTSGWQYPDWRGAFYPSGLASTRWLEHYAATFATVEANSPFYRLPNARRSNGGRPAPPTGSRSR